MNHSGRTIRFFLASTFLVTAVLAGASVWSAIPAMANAGAGASASGSREAAITAPSATPDNDGSKAVYSEPEKRIALVIGNSAYENVARLPNPANDAKAMSQFLNSAGFEVIAANDLNQDEMIQVLQDFSAKIAERGPNSVAFVYYAGHGVQVAGDNYLIPVDARISTEADLPNEAVRLVDLMATLQAVPSRMRMVVLDACRNNPFSRLKDTGRGLAMVDAPNGSIVAYSTAPGTEALDGEGSNSPYTSAFLRLGREKNLPIEQLFKKVRLDVNNATDGQQTPWESSSLTSDFYFFGDTRNAMASAVMPETRQTPSQRVAAARTIRDRTPREAYALAVQEDAPEYYEEFVRVYPHDPFADRIRRLLASRLLSIAWHGAVIANSPAGYKNFYSQYSGSPYASLAQKLETQPKALPLYQPTKILVPPQLAPQVKLTSFNGAPVPQGTNSPLNWLSGKKLSTTGLMPVNGGINAGLPGNGRVVPTMNGQMPHVSPLKTAPGVDLAKNGPRFDKTLDARRVTTLPQQTSPQPGRPMPANLATKGSKGQAGMADRRNDARIGTRIERGPDSNGMTPLRASTDAVHAGRKPMGQVARPQPRVNVANTASRMQPAPRIINRPVQTFGSNRPSRTVSMNSSGGFGRGGGFSRSSFR